jgi:hypothetical protein
LIDLGVFGSGDTLATYYYPPKVGPAPILRVKANREVEWVSLRAEERGADPRVALDVVADTLARQARRHQKRLRDRNHANVTKEAAAAAALNAQPAAAVADDEVDEYVLGRVVRAKHFEAKPMSQEEALAQMDHRPRLSSSRLGVERSRAALQSARTATTASFAPRWCRAAGPPHTRTGCELPGDAG